VNALHPRGLIDEYRLMVFPVTLGVGKHLFGRGNGTRGLKLTDLKSTSTGVALLTYVPDS
jgi:dihydrofolate reductase